jgi:Gram-negative bacterial TonB protein C-terminal
MALEACNNLDVVWAAACGALRGLIVYLRCVALRRTRDNTNVASAADQLPSTVSPSANPSKTSGENAPNKPRMNAVACEVQVIATGARPSEKDGQRELFTEETSTALVFENGGVLKLSSAVIVGQLLFLTHKETKREVVAQVTRKRDFRPTICYVEVEFSELSPGFWGIEFPKTPAMAPANAQQKEADHSARAEEDFIGGEPIEPTPAPSAEEVSALKDEVEVLREQLKLLQTQIVAGNPPASAETHDHSQATTPEALRGPVGVAPQAPLLADASGQPLEKLQTTAGEASQKMPAEVSVAFAGAHGALSPAPASLPSDRAETPFSEEDLLPKPALNFENAKPAAKASSKPKQKIAADPQRAALRKDFLFAAFVIITAGAAWYQNLLPWLPQRKNFSPSTAPSSAGHPAPRAPAQSADDHADSGKSAETSEGPANSPSAISLDASQPAAPRTAKPSTKAAAETPAGEVKSAPDAAANDAAVPEKPEIAASVGKRSAAPSLSKAAMVSAVPPADGAGVVPPKLIKSVRAVASPSMLQYFAPGNGDSVTLDALVDTSGRVKSMKALSGPASLRNAAIEALKQYTYEPATQRGKPVAAHITVKIKFLFEP